MKGRKVGIVATGRKQTGIGSDGIQGIGVGIEVVVAVVVAAVLDDAFATMSNP